MAHRIRTARTARRIRLAVLEGRREAAVIRLFLAESGLHPAHPAWLASVAVAVVSFERLDRLTRTPVGHRQVIARRRALGIRALPVRTV